MFKHLLAIFILLIFVPIAFAEEDSVSFATYYPAPYGVYHEMRTDQQSIGTGYRSNPVPTDGLIVEGNVGIGVNAPVDKLEVSGGIKIGNSSNTQPGTMRWDGSEFQGYSGTPGSWKKLGGPGTLSCIGANLGSNFANCPSGYMLTGGGCSVGYPKYQVLGTESAIICYDAEGSMGGSGSYGICCKID